MNSNIILDFFKGFITGISQLGVWLVTPIGIGDFSFTPLVLVSVTGLLIFVGVAMVKWIAS